MQKNYSAPLVKIFLYNEDVITSSGQDFGDDNVVFWSGTTKEVREWE